MFKNVFKKKVKLHFGKQATKVSTALCCLSFFFFFLHHCGPVAPLSGAWHVFQTDRRKAHSLSLLARLHHCHHHQPSVYLNTSQEPSILHWATASVPAHQAKILLVLPSCSVPEVPADGDTGPQLWSVCDPALQWPPENIYAAAGWTDGGIASHFLLLVLFHCWNCLRDRWRMNLAKVNVKSYSMPDLTSTDFSERSIVVHPKLAKTKILSWKRVHQRTHVHSNQLSDGFLPDISECVCGHKGWELMAFYVVPEK